MDIRFQTGGPSQWKADVVVTFVFEGEGVEEACAALAQSAVWLSIAPAWRDFHGGRDESVMFYGPQAMEISRVLGVGLGKADKADMTAFRYAVARPFAAAATTISPPWGLTAPRWPAWPKSWA